jgi:hypothetical protein
MGGGMIRKIDRADKPPRNFAAPKVELSRILNTHGYRD